MLYVIYMFSFIDLCGFTLPAYWIEVKKKNEAISKGMYNGE